MADRIIPPLPIVRGRTNRIPVSTPYDLSTSTLTSEIREGRHPNSLLIATWTVSFKTDGSDGELFLTLGHTITAAITADKGYTDIKWVLGGEPYPMFNPVVVEFVDAVTA